MGGQNNDVGKNERKELCITRATNYDTRKLIITSDTPELHRDALKDRNTSTAEWKRPSDYTDISLLSINKRTCSSLLTKNRDNFMK